MGADHCPKHRGCRGAYVLAREESHWEIKVQGGWVSWEPACTGEHHPPWQRLSVLLEQDGAQ